MVMNKGNKRSFPISSQRSIGVRIKGKTDNINCIAKRAAKKRLFISILLIIALFAVGVVVMVAVDRNNYEYLTELVRPESGEADREYALEVLCGDRQSNITVYIEPAAMEKEQLERLFDEAWNELERKLLGENLSVNSITQPLELVSELPEYNMSVEWFIENREVVDYWGDIHQTEEPCSVQLTASLTYGGNAEEEAVIVREHTYELIVLPYTREQRERMELYEFILEADRKNSLEKNIVLPDMYEGEKIMYRRIKEQSYIGILILLVSVPFLLYIKGITDNKQKKKRLEDEYIREYPEIISRLSLLIGAGMTPYNAFIRICSDGKGEAYEQLKNMIKRIQSGKSERLEYADFGRIFKVQCYSRLGTMLEQNVVRGNERLRQMLRDECMEAFEERKARARKAGEQAGTKLLMPMMMMLIVVMVIIMVPAFMSF